MPLKGHWLNTIEEDVVKAYFNVIPIAPNVINLSISTHDSMGLVITVPSLNDLNHGNPSDLHVLSCKLGMFQPSAPVLKGPFSKLGTLTGLKAVPT